MNQSLDNATKQELMAELLERLKGIKLEDIKARVDQALKDPAVAEGIKGAEEKFDKLRETLPGMMESQIQGVTSLVVKEIQENHPELAEQAKDVIEQIKEYKIPEEDLKKLQEDVVAAKKNFGQWYDERLRDTVNDAVDDLKERITKQFNSAVEEEEVNIAAKKDSAVVGMADTLMQMYKNNGRASVESMVPALQAQGEFGKNVVSLLNKNLADAGEKPFETQSVPVPVTGVVTP